MIFLQKAYLWDEYRTVIHQLLLTETVQKMHRHAHHGSLSCFEHSVFVSYIAFRIARRVGMDTHAAARAGLLHDLYLYNPAIMGMRQCFFHPLAAFENAKNLCPDLSEKEGNAIRSHMFPLSKELPRSRVALVVNLADKFCATVEALRIFNRLPIRGYVRMALSGA